MLATAVALVLATDPAVQLAHLAARYRDYDLPLPPKDAKLYCFTVHYIAQPGDNPFTPSYQFGFGIAANKSGKPTNVLMGLHHDDWVPGFATKIEEVQRGTSWTRPMDKEAVELPFIAQCELLGYHALARTAFKHWRRKPQADLNTRKGLTDLAWDYWEGEFRHHNADRAKVARRLNGMADRLGRTDDPFLTKLNLSLKPSGSKAGTPEAAVDELMDVANYLYRRRGDGLDTRLEAVYRFGFDAIPALIAHLDDDRLTRTYHHGYFFHRNFPCESYDYTVKHLVRDILFRYMGTENAQSAAETTNTPKSDVVKAWWEAAKQVGEADYLLRRVLSDEAWETGAHDQLLAVILAKYPKRLPDVLAGLKKADPVWTPLDPFVDALLRSTLPVAEQKKQLVVWTGGPDRDWQAAALTGLHRLDADEFQDRLIAILAALPAVEDAKYEKSPSPDRYTGFAEVARLTADAKVWTAVGKYLNNATPEVKLAWIDQLTGNARNESVSQARATVCVATLLTDKTERVQKNGDRLDRTEVRNYAAKRLGDMLDVREMPTDDAPASKWEAYREEVAKAAKAVR